MTDEFTETRADKIKRWGAKWAKIRDNATTPAIRTYAEQYLDMLRRQLRAELDKQKARQAKDGRA